MADEHVAQTVSVVHGEVKMNTDISSDNMIKKMLILLCFLCLSTMIVWYVQNNDLPLGFDHGIYSHLTHTIQNSGNVYSIPDYLRYQYEPSSGTLLYALTKFTGNEVLYTW